MSSPEKFAEHAMNTLWGHYEAGNLDTSILALRGLGYRPEAVDFVLNPDSYYFPNRRNDQLVTPKGTNPDLIPVVALDTAKTYKFQKPSLHYLQRLALIGSGYSADQLEKISGMFYDSSDTISSSGGQPGDGSVHRRLIPSPTKHDLRISSSPTIIFNLEGAHHRAEEICTSGVLHELVHVVQTLSAPIRQKDDILQRELEAYGTQAILVYSDNVPYTLATAKAGTVDNFRRKYLGENVFVPTPEFRQLFEMDGLLSYKIETTW